MLLRSPPGSAAAPAAVPTRSQACLPRSISPQPARFQPLALPRSLSPQPRQHSPMGMRLVAGGSMSSTAPIDSRSCSPLGRRLGASISVPSLAQPLQPAGAVHGRPCNPCRALGRSQIPQRSAIAVPRSQANGIYIAPISAASSSVGGGALASRAGSPLPPGTPESDDRRSVGTLHLLQSTLVPNVPKAASASHKLAVSASGVRTPQAPGAAAAQQRLAGPLLSPPLEGSSLATLPGSTVQERKRELTPQPNRRAFAEPVASSQPLQAPAAALASSSLTAPVLRAATSSSSLRAASSAAPSTLSSTLLTDNGKCDVAASNGRQQHAETLSAAKRVNEELLAVASANVNLLGEAVQKAEVAARRIAIEEALLATEMTAKGRAKSETSSPAEATVFGNAPAEMAALRDQLKAAMAQQETLMQRLPPTSASAALAATLSGNLRVPKVSASDTTSTLGPSPPTSYFDSPGLKRSAESLGEDASAAPKEVGGQCEDGCNNPAVSSSATTLRGSPNGNADRPGIVQSQGTALTPKSLELLFKLSRSEDAGNKNGIELLRLPEKGASGQKEAPSTGGTQSPPSPRSAGRADDTVSFGGAGSSGDGAECRKLRAQLAKVQRMAEESRRAWETERELMRAQLLEAQAKLAERASASSSSKAEASAAVPTRRQFTDTAEDSQSRAHEHVNAASPTEADAASRPSPTLPTSEHQAGADASPWQPAISLPTFGTHLGTAGPGSSASSSVHAGDAGGSEGEAPSNSLTFRQQHDVASLQGSAEFELLKLNLRSAMDALSRLESGRDHGASGQPGIFAPNQAPAQMLEQLSAATSAAAVAAAACLPSGTPLRGGRASTDSNVTCLPSPTSPDSSLQLPPQVAGAAKATPVRRMPSPPRPLPDPSSIFLDRAHEHNPLETFTTGNEAVLLSEPQAMPPEAAAEDALQPQRQSETRDDAVVAAEKPGTAIRRAESVYEPPRSPGLAYRQVALSEEQAAMEAVAAAVDVTPLATLSHVLQDNQLQRQTWDTIPKLDCSFSETAGLGAMSTASSASSAPPILSTAMPLLPQDSRLLVKNELQKLREWYKTLPQSGGRG
eukprot:TRINITY_DN41717_c0_g1_i3.p1 TRINITY_DN41717_c0_g1~~TRINITY_DN41717_c0_g1_i3.p1  ORF type:complete len:1080 (+),score=224.73 TRINITY_DN41717_c0_g1_i3:102-3341(+)